MPQLPARPNLDHLKKQAKDLLAFYRKGDRAAIARFRDTLPVAAGKDDPAIARLGLRLHDSQSCLAREYGFVSWTDLRSFVDARTAAKSDRPASVLAWLRLVYAGDIAGGSNRARPSVAARLLDEDPDFARRDRSLACASGDETRVREAAGNDPEWVRRPSGPLNLPPLVAVTHSSLLRLPPFRERLHACARFLLDAGADANQAVGDRSPPASLAEPARSSRLSALYGAAGQNHDAELTRMLLAAGADPNDGESLYHALESVDCTRLLLEAGARVRGTNAVYRVLDLDALDALNLLLTYGADPNEPATSVPTADWGSPLLWAIRRRRSPAHVAALLKAGADPRTTGPDGVSADVWALRFGLPDVAGLLGRGGVRIPLSDDERFIAACADGREAEARRIQSVRRDLPAALSAAQLRLLPEFAATGNRETVQLMVKLGWPIATPGGDWQASALNHAVFRGDAALTRFLLEHGASWTERHGHGDNVCGTLSWASLNEPIEGGDWVGCAEALVAHGMRAATQDADEGVPIEGRRMRFSEEVTEVLVDAARPGATLSEA